MTKFKTWLEIILTFCVTTYIEAARDELHFSSSKLKGPLATLYVYDSNPTKIYAYIARDVGTPNVDQGYRDLEWAMLESMDGIQFTEINGGFFNSSLPDLSGGVSCASSESHYTEIVTYMSKKQNWYLQEVLSPLSAGKVLQSGELNLDSAALSFCFNSKKKQNQAILVLKDGTDLTLYLLSKHDTNAQQQSVVSLAAKLSHNPSEYSDLKIHQIESKVILLQKWCNKNMTEIPLKVNNHLTYYMIADIKIVEGTIGLTLDDSEEIILDYGHDVESFSVVKFRSFDYIIGWFTQSSTEEGIYPDIGHKALHHFTTMRRIDLQGGRIIQRPIDLSSRILSRSAFKKGIIGGEPGRCQDFITTTNTNDRDGYFFEFKLSHTLFNHGPFDGLGGYEIHLNSKTGKSLVVGFAAGSPIQAKEKTYIFWVNRLKTFLEPKKGPKLVYEARGETEKQNSASVSGDVKIILDRSSIEVFFEDGKYTISERYFIAENERLREVCVMAHTMGEVEIIEAKITRLANVFQKFEDQKNL